MSFPAPAPPPVFPSFNFGNSGAAPVFGATPAPAAPPPIAFPSFPPASVPAPAFGFPPAPAPLSSSAFNFAVPATTAAPAPATSASLFSNVNFTGAQAAVTAPPAISHSTLVKDLPEPIKNVMKAIQAHLDKEKAAASALKGESSQRLDVLTAETSAVAQVQEEVSFQQGRLRDNVELLSGVIADNEHHLETAVNHIRMAPSNYVRDVPLPPPFLSEYASDASVRMASLRDSIREVEAVLAPAGGDTPPPSGPTQLIAAALTTQGEQFIRLSGGKIAPLHDLTNDLRRDTIECLREQLNTLISEGKIDTGGGGSGGGGGPFGRQQSLLSRIQIDPFVDADAREKKAAKAAATAHADFMASSAPPQTAAPALPPASGASSSWFGVPASAPAPFAPSFMAPIPAPAPPAAPFGGFFGAAPAPAAPAPAFPSFPAFGSPPAPATNKTVTWGTTPGFATPAPATGGSLWGPVHTPGVSTKKKSGKSGKH